MLSLTPFIAMATRTVTPIPGRMAFIWGHPFMAVTTRGDTLHSVLLFTILAAALDSMAAAFTEAASTGPSACTAVAVSTVGADFMAAAMGANSLGRRDFLANCRIRADKMRLVWQALFR